MSNSRMQISSGDITALHVDAIVNAANETLLGGGGVDGAIHRAAGPRLLEACLEVPEIRAGVRCPTGEARITPGFDLPARHVVHTVGPVWSGGASGEAEALASCYMTSILLAAEHGVTSIAFPAISCGAYGYPIADACRVAVSTIAACLDADPRIQMVVFAAFGSDVESELASALEAQAGDARKPSS